MSLRILVLDEDPDVRTFYGTIFEQTNYTIDLAETRFEALKLIKDSQDPNKERKPYQFMITDCGYGPVRDRMDVIYQIQRLNPRLKLIAVSDRPDFRKEMYPYASATFNKPFSPKALLNKIKEIEEEFI